MWHNSTTHGLTGKQQKLTGIWWTYGAGNLSGRRIVQGPYRGERVYSLGRRPETLCGQAWACPCCRLLGTP